MFAFELVCGCIFSHAFLSACAIVFYSKCWLCSFLLQSYSESESCSVISDSLRPQGLYSPWNSPGQNTGVGSLSLLQGIEPGSPALQADSLPAEPPRKPKNTGVGSHSLLQGIFLTQGSNPGLPHCRRILYQPSWQVALCSSIPSPLSSSSFSSLDKVSCRTA